MMEQKKETEELLKKLIGESKECAISICKENGYKVRITKEDSISFVIPLELRFDRINLQIEKGIVVSCHVG